MIGEIGADPDVIMYVNQEGNYDIAKYIENKLGL